VSYGNALDIDEAPATPARSETSGYIEYHIIAGSFESGSNAQELQQKLTMAGYPSMILNTGDGFYRVSANSYTDKEKALQELYLFREREQMENAWLMALE